jgi:hypothetical protein
MDMDLTLLLLLILVPAAVCAGAILCLRPHNEEVVVEVSGFVVVRD